MTSIKESMYNQLMANTIPNKETIRRLCLLHKVESCYLLSDTKSVFVDLLIELEDQHTELFRQELESWCGMKFKLFNKNSNEKDIIRIKNEGELIYPLSEVEPNN